MPQEGEILRLSSLTNSKFFEGLFDNNFFDDWRFAQGWKLKNLSLRPDETDSNAKAFREDFLYLGAKTDLYRCQVRSEHEVMK